MDKTNETINFEVGDFNLTVGKLKECLKDLPDDMYIIIPCNEDVTDYNRIDDFRLIRTAGILENRYEEKPALCLNTSYDGLDISSQVKQYCGDSTSCTRVLF